MDDKIKTQNGLESVPMKVNDNTIKFIKEKTKYLMEIMQNTILAINYYKEIDVFSSSEMFVCTNVICTLYNQSKEVYNSNFDENAINDIIDKLQTIIDKLSNVLCSYGTKNVNDLLFISFGSEFKQKQFDTDILKEKFDLILKFIHPIGYKTIHWKNAKVSRSNNGELCSNKLSEEIIKIETSNNFECFDLQSDTKSIYGKIHGIKVVMHSDVSKKTIIINGIVDNIIIDCISNKYLDARKKSILSGNNTSNETFIRLLDSFTLKDYLIHGNADISKRLMAIQNEITTVKNEKIDIVMKRFIKLDTLDQRNMLINLLLYNSEDNIQYIAYLLYDLITSINGNHSDQIDNPEQKIIYDSFPWKIKMYFKNAMKHTIKFTQDIVSKYDLNRVTLEQQIFLLNVQDNIKEKAMIKLKEIKGKSDDSGTKAKQYLEGLLKIPFGVYREERFLKLRDEINVDFNKFIADFSKLSQELKEELLVVPNKTRYMNYEILKHISSMESMLKSAILKYFKNNIQTLTKIQSSRMLKSIRQTYPQFDTTQKVTRDILSFLQSTECKLKDAVTLYDMTYSSNENSIVKLCNNACIIKSQITDVERRMKSVTDTLDNSIYGHKDAKNQMLKIITQWMNGKSSGYCFGFEGSPGIGKTSLAKNGLSACMKDDDGSPRPFTFIAIGGSANGSLLEGHSYTYVNSYWGKIVDVLMETKCLNPIIYVDELDKISKTENGKEIIGILTHLIDPTQNDIFQDKYFSGINIDLSKALFIFSYNDAEQIDRILLDRIHRIKFDNLTTSDKLVIMNKYIIPEIINKMGFCNDTVTISDDTLEYIIETYTMEPGVRKLKEIMFDLYGEINIELMMPDPVIVGNNNSIVIDKELLEKKYFKNRVKINETKIHSVPKIGIMNGLWANSLGKGGIIPIECTLFPSATFLDLKLTGLQGDVMKESMNVAKSLAWQLTSEIKKKEWLKRFEDTRCQGLHIHCPDGAVSKDGPSAGAAITLTIYSLFNELTIDNTLAITGEINLQGDVTPIGGLSCKILGGIRAGVKHFMYPASNQPDLDEFMDKNNSSKAIVGIKFTAVKTIHEIIELVFR